MQTQQQDNHAELRAFVESLSLEYSATFVPMSKAENRDAPGINWSITIKNGRSALTTTYFQGIAHVKGYSHKFGRKTLEDVERGRLVLKTCETGKVYKGQAGKVRMGTMFAAGIAYDQPAPELLDVLYCLVSDSDAIECGGFEEWAGNFGYDTDSRKAEAIYRQCVDIGLKLRQLVGNDNLTKLRELFSDY